MSDHLVTTRSNFEYWRSLEYIETNGLGGYVSSTVSGAHSRKYHGLLVAALKPPVHRMVVVSKIQETVLSEGKYYALSCNQFPGVVYPNGVQHLIDFKHDLFPEFIYQAGDVVIKKTIAAVYGENTTLILYEVLAAPDKFVFDLQPFYSCRDNHQLSYANDQIGYPYLFDKGTFRTLNYQGCAEIFIAVPKSQFTEARSWHHNFEYNVEQERGLDFQEDLYTHGQFSVTLRKGSRLGVIVSLEDPTGRDAFKLFREQKKRKENICKEFSNALLKNLVLAADQFIVKRDDLSTIMAGYPWFSDWGRDSMIALPGLCLETGRIKDAKRIIQEFSGYVSEGMLPNRFPDTGEEPEYNTIDATLWFFQAIYKYYKYSTDKVFVKSLLPILRDIIDWHYKGTRYNIKIDESDELITGGKEGVQLTWMDAKVEHWVVTPRIGKAVEINALWYNALRIMEYFLNELNYQGDAEFFKAKAEIVIRNFNSAFWNESGNCLYDYIDDTQKNADIRPNQVYAISLPFPLLDKEKAVKVMKVVKEHLVTPYGLRSLSPKHSEYKSHYVGNLWQRDGAYHQGTVWSHLIGPYIDALFYTEGKKAKAEASSIIKSFAAHLNDAGLGSISEIFDGDFPHKPRGCYAQAWSVAEVLRVIKAYDLVPEAKEEVAMTSEVSA